MAKSKCFGLQKKGQMRSLCASVAMCVLFVRDLPQIPNFVIKNIGALQRNLVLRVSQEAMFTVQLTKFYHNMAKIGKFLMQTQLWECVKFFASVSSRKKYLFNHSSKEVSCGQTP